MWHSQLTDGLCPACWQTKQTKNAEQTRQLALRIKLMTLGGGEKPYREFRFESYEVIPENELAFTRSRAFNPDRDNLYLWGPCGVGKTHLAFAIARRFCELNRSVEFLQAPRLMRRVRMKDPVEEQQAIDRLVRADVFALDHLGIGTDSAYARQIFQEVLDGRMCAYRNGLIVTTRFSLDALATKLGDDTISSRLAGLCRVIQVGGRDHRLPP